jgi:hypothetical protein
MDLGRPYVHVEPLVVSLSDAGAKPWAVVVMHCHTAVTDLAVKHAGGLDNIASWASFALDLILEIKFAAFAPAV